MTKNITWKRDEFIEFLISKKSISKEVASDYASRCVRVENAISVNLITSTRNAHAYTELLHKISIYADTVSSSPSQRYALGGTMRLAVKRFAEFNKGSDFSDIITGHTVKFRK